MDMADGKDVGLPWSARMYFSCMNDNYYKLAPRHGGHDHDVGDVQKVTCSFLGWQLCELIQRDGRHRRGDDESR